MNVYLASSEATEDFGCWLGRVLAATSQGTVFTFEGELGAGKTALIRAILCGLGYSGIVVSPSYTLVESYELHDRRAHHLDLYRISDPSELEFLGVRELPGQRDFMFVEWPEQGAGFLPSVDVAVAMAYQSVGRAMTLKARSRTGQAILDMLAD